MNFKKAVVLIMSMFLVFGIAGCKEKGPKSNYLSNDEVEKRYPLLKETKEYLLEHYPFPREVQEYRYEKNPVKFLYRCGEGTGDCLYVDLYFEESVTKRQMIEASEYVAEKFKEIFSENDIVTLKVETGVIYTDDGTFVREMWTNKEKIRASFFRGRPEDISWKITTVEEGETNDFLRDYDNESDSQKPAVWIPFDPESVKEGERPKQLIWPETLPKVEEGKEEEKTKEVETKYPPMKEAKEYLLEHYPLTEKQIEFYYDDREVLADWLIVRIYFDESITKRQMINASYYVAEKFKAAFPQDDDSLLDIIMGVKYTEDGILAENMWKEKEKIRVSFARNNSLDMQWRITAVQGDGREYFFGDADSKAVWTRFNPDDVKEDEKPKDLIWSEEKTKEDNETLKEEPKEEPDNTVKVIPGLKLGEIKEYLESGDVKEFSFIEEGEGYLSTGIDSDGAYGYTAFVDKNKEDVISVMYMITHKQNLTDEEFLELAQLYLSAVGSYPYEGVDTAELTDFIINNVEEVIKTGEAKTKVIGGLTFSIGYLGNSVTLTVLNETE